MIQSNLSQDEKEVTHARQIKALRLLFLLLPPENYQLLHDVLILLHRVAAHQKQNLMSAVNLGTMFAPHILCPRKVCTHTKIVCSYYTHFQIMEGRNSWANKGKVKDKVRGILRKSKMIYEELKANLGIHFVKRKTLWQNSKDVEGKCFFFPQRFLSWTKVSETRT